MRLFKLEEMAHKQYGLGINSSRIRKTDNYEKHYRLPDFDTEKGLTNCQIITL